MSNTSKYPLILVLDMSRGKPKLKFCQKANDSFFSKQIKKKKKVILFKTKRVLLLLFTLG